MLQNVAIFRFLAAVAKAKEARNYRTILYVSIQKEEWIQEGLFSDNCILNIKEREDHIEQFSRTSLTRIRFRANHRSLKLQFRSVVAFPEKFSLEDNFLIFPSQILWNTDIGWRGTFGQIKGMLHLQGDGERYLSTPNRRQKLGNPTVP